MKVNYEPCGHRVLVEVHVIEDKSKGGILLTSVNRDRENVGAERGTVRALGPTAYQDFTGDPWVKVGDNVMFKRYEGVVIEEDDKMYRILNDDDIYTKVND